jgi:phenylpyruvate tautomerase PptA (4-oxalocrotonate tautomerase family)
MPILEVEIVLRPGEVLADGLAAALADAAAGAMGTPVGRTWVRLGRIERSDYAEDGGGPPVGVFPVFVRVLKAERPSGDELRAEAARLTDAIARACMRPAENVHVLYEESARGRLAFGGDVV